MIEDLSVNQANGIFRLIRQMGGAMKRKVQGALSNTTGHPGKGLLMEEIRAKF